MATIKEDDVEVIIDIVDEPEKPKRKRGMRDILAKMTPEEYETYLIQPANFDVPLKCDKCSVTFMNNVEKGLHSIKHNAKGLYECHVCEDFVHQNRQAFDIHIRDHEGIKKYKCPICNKQFTIIRPAYEHKYLHNKEKPFDCDICGKKFTTSITARNHKNVAHYEMLNGQKFDKYDCKICNKHYDHNSGLAHHNFRHHKELVKRKPALCEACGMDFSCVGELKKHALVHSKDTPFACDHCPKKFARIWRLRQHQAVHTGEKKYTCGDCGKKFAYSSAFKNHKRLHTGEKPHTCRVCGKGYIAAGNLRFHLNSVHKIQVNANTEKN
ncbi:oocyte zinc finger protein XlCOF19-like [Diabrotica virgifera virgifera]|uniref:Oocyte zinc finger protein XlCOF19-like n=1 Tax=Diabrotica virgifera virgifera TaxID=50390 RepID=A0A6P7F1I2_DIAVI|nr:oocyte zinc finger protein XlCOF19-like [Diabrotica virgifera virgifera]